MALHETDRLAGVVRVALRSGIPLKGFSTAIMEAVARAILDRRGRSAVDARAAEIFRLRTRQSSGVHPRK